MKCYYAIEYLLLLIKNNNKNNKINNVNKEFIENKKIYKYNPQQLIKENILTYEKIINYKNQLTSEILLYNQSIRKFLQFINYFNNFNDKQVFWLFEIIIKAKMFKKCENILKNNDKITEEEKTNLIKFVNNNINLINLDDKFFNELD
jgi:superfamily II DNA or RNA helicase